MPTTQENIYVPTVDLEHGHARRRGAAPDSQGRRFGRTVKVPLRYDRSYSFRQRIVFDVEAVVLRVGRPPGAAAA